MTKDEALKLAMEAMEITGGFDVEINAIKEALAQPEPWEKFCDSNCVWTDHHPDCKLAERLPLTENEIKHLWYEACQTNLELTSQLIVHLAKNIEAAHGIKGEA